MIMRFLYFIFLFVLTLAFQPVQAQKAIATHTHAWFMYFGNHRISQHWGLHTEYQWRRSEWVNQWQQSLLRLGVDYYADDKNTLTAGYAWIVTFPYGEQPVTQSFTEHRIWEQWIINHRAGLLYVNHRYRLEQRFLEQPNEEEYVFRQRARYRLMLMAPLGKTDLTDNTLFLATYIEPFIGFGKGIGKNVLDQNRLYFALGYRVNRQTNIQLGYLNQYVIKTDGIRQERNHTLQVGLTYNMDFRE